MGKHEKDDVFDRTFIGKPLWMGLIIVAVVGYIVYNAWK